MMAEYDDNGRAAPDNPDNPPRRSPLPGAAQVDAWLEQRLAAFDRARAERAAGLRWCEVEVDLDLELGAVVLRIARDDAALADEVLLAPGQAIDVALRLAGSAQRIQGGNR